MAGWSAPLLEPPVLASVSPRQRRRRARRRRSSGLGPGGFVDDPSDVTDEANPTVRIRASRPCADAEVLTVVGDIDTEVLDRFDEAWPHACPQLRLVVLDLSGVGAVGVADVPGVRLLTRAYVQAQAAGLGLRVVATDPAVLQALRAAGLDRLCGCCGSLTEALRPGPAADR